MELSGSEFKQLESALLSAFPNVIDLKRLIRQDLDVHLGEIDWIGSIKDVIFRLIEWAESRGRLEDLVRAALNINPNNPNLDSFAKSKGLRVPAILSKNTNNRIQSRVSSDLQLPEGFSSIESYLDRGITEIEIADVSVTLDPSKQWFQLYNATKRSIHLEGWSICTANTCNLIPNIDLDAYSSRKISVASIVGWPPEGLNSISDMLGLLNENGQIADCLNWGYPSRSWENYKLFQSALWHPGVKAPDPLADQSFFRSSVGKDSNKPTDWLGISRKRH